MIISSRIFAQIKMIFFCCHWRIQRKKIIRQIKCAAKTSTFLFWAILYIFVMKLTIFKKSTDSKINRGYIVNNSLYKDVWAENFMESTINDNYVDSNWYDIQKELEERNNIVQATCRKFGLGEEGEINNEEFFVEPNVGLIWCNIFKAASSSWMYKFNLLGGYSEYFLSFSHHSPLTLARAKYPRPSTEDLLAAFNEPGSTSFMIVREPFERLLSAYRDKLESNVLPYYHTMRRRIVKRYRNETNLLFGPVKNKGPTFYEFVRHITENYKKSKNRYGLDEHWAPYYKFCSPCTVNYSIIAKVETLERDSEYIIKQIGWESILLKPISTKRVRVRTVMNKARDGKNTKSLLQDYFKQINKKLLNDLLDIYRIDFEMFAYNTSIYSTYVKD